ncbi:MAG: hypothetical protein SWH68_08705 [Thermodesulfobacteriota bacterium]|nr:hypothetical protein [Thermodesulfobacteriota bacterium]
MLEWLQHNETLLWWLAGGSVVTFFGTLILVPWLIVHIPEDYFFHHKRRKLPWAGRHPAVRIVFIVCKNLLGCLFVAAGVLMLMLPGQGLLTIVLGGMLMDFPGKYKLERWAVSRGPVLKAINRLRARANRPPIIS